MNGALHSSGTPHPGLPQVGGPDARRVLDAIPQAVVATDDAGRACYFNSAAKTLISGRWRGCPPEDLLTMLDLDSGLPLSLLVQRCLRAESSPHEAGQALLPGDYEAPALVDYLIRPVPGVGSGALVLLREGALLDALDVRREGIAEPRSAAAPVVSRKAFESRVARALSSLRRGSCHALLHLALGRYEEAEKACGHAAAAALRERGCHQITFLVRQRDTLSRFGPSTFGLLMEHCPLERAVERARRIHEVMGEQELRWGNMHFRLDVSIGVVPVRKRTHTVRELLALAREASRNASENGGNGVCVFADAGEEDRLLLARDREWREYIREVLF